MTVSVSRPQAQAPPCTYGFTSQLLAHNEEYTIGFNKLQDINSTEVVMLCVRCCLQYGALIMHFKLQSIHLPRCHITYCREN